MSWLKLTRAINHKICECTFHNPHLFKSPPQVSLSLHKKPQDHQMGPPIASSANKRPLKFSRENLNTPKHPQKGSMCHFKSHTEPLETSESHGSRTQDDSQWVLKWLLKHVVMEVFWQEGCLRELRKTVYQTVYHECLFTSDSRIPKLLKLFDSMTDQMPSWGNDPAPGHHFLRYV